MDGEAAPRAVYPSVRSGRCELRQFRFSLAMIFFRARRPAWRSSSAAAISRRLAALRARARNATTSCSESSFRRGIFPHCTGEREKPEHNFSCGPGLNSPERHTTIPAPFLEGRDASPFGGERGGGLTWTASFFFFQEFAILSALPQPQRERGFFLSLQLC